MSFYSDSSLVVIPSGYKTSKVYSAVPTDGTGDLTFTRSNDTATRVASNGLIEKVRTNLLTYSNDFSNAAWTKTNVTLTTGQADPNGGLTATTVNATNGTSAFVRQYISITSGIKYAWSVYIKGSTTGQSIALYTDGASNIYEIKALTTSWQRFTGVATAASSGSSGFYILCGSGYSGLTDLPFYIAFGQVEASDIATDYIATTTAAVSVGPLANIPRIDYLGGGCGKLLLEPQATALNQFSESFDNAYWIKNDVTISANTTETLDPAGYYGADKVVETATAARHRVAAGSTTISAANHTASVFMKKGTARYGFVTFSGAAVSTIVVDLENGTITSTSTSGTIVAQKVEDYGSGWYRISVTALGTATTTTYTLQFGSAGSATPSYTSNIPSFTGSTSNYLYAWGANLTATSYLQSYIPTLAASVTRGADVVQKTSISSLIGQTEGVVFLDYTATQVASANSEFSISAGTNSNAIRLRQSSGNFLQGVVQNGGVTQASIITTSPISVGQRYKIAFAYANNDFAMYVNGQLIGIDGSGSVPACSQVQNTNGGASSTADLAGAVNQVLLFKTRLPNSELASLTTL